MHCREAWGNLQGIYRISWGWLLGVGQSVVVLVALIPIVAVQAQTLGTPPNITDTYAASNQVGYCIDSGGSGSCTANDFLITSIDILNVDDGCSGPDDYMQIDAIVNFNKATPQRNDITVWFYRGDDQATLPNPDFVSQNARVGDFCSRIMLDVGTVITREVAPFDVVGVSGLLDPDSCADVPNTPNGNLEQVVSDLVLPCRDIGIPDPSDPQGTPLSNVPDGIIDVSGCTSWDNNANTFCDGPEYDGVGEPAAGTGSKCNCGEFSGITTQVGLPDISVTKVCSPTDVAPGDATSCEINIINAGTGTQIGATAAGIEGFFYEDDYPENQGSVTNVVTTQGSVVDGFTLDANGVSTSNQSLNIYPGDILGGTTLTITYDFVTSPSLPTTLTTITNVVCASYLDFGEDGSPEVFSYAFDPDLCATEEITTPVTLAGVDIQVQYGGLQFDWITASETNNLGFNIYVLRGQTYFKLNDDLIPSQSVTTLDESRYSLWLDAGIDIANQKFFIEDVDLQGKATKNGPFVLSKGSVKPIPKKDTDWAQISKAAKQHSALNAKRSGKNTGENNAKEESSQERVIPLELIEGGLQRVFLSEIETNGISISDMERGRYSLTGPKGDQVASRVVKGRKGEEGYLEFIGISQKTFYSNKTSYQLRSVAKNQSAIQIESNPRGGRNKTGSEVSPYYMHTERLATDSIYVNLSKVKDDPWMMSKSFANRVPKVDTYEIPVSNAYGEGVSATVSAVVAGGIDFEDLLDHSVQLHAESQMLASREFAATDVAVLDGLTSIDQSASSLLVEVVTVPTNSYGVDLVYTDQISVTYPRKYVAQNNRLSFSSTDQSFLVEGFTDQSVFVFAKSESGLGFIGQINSEAGAISFGAVDGTEEYFLFGESTYKQPDLTSVVLRDILGFSEQHLIIAHPSFMGEELDEYVAWRNVFASEGSVVVSTDEIYSQYSNGARDANAIHEYIIELNAVNELSSVLIVGGDSYDYHDNLGIGSISFVPTLYKATGDLIQYSPVDSLYGDVDRDSVPDIAVGRLPVRTVEELKTILAKSKLFAEQGGNTSAMLAADELRASNAYNFTESSENVALSLLAKDWDVDRAYIDVLGPSGAREALLRGLNSGPRLALYTGHSSTNVWSGKRIFTYADTESLSNDDHPSAYLQWGCYNTYFSSPTSDTMSHGLMLAGDQGAALVLGSSTLTNAYAEARFSVLLQDELLRDGVSFGQAMVDAKQQYYRETGLTYKGILLGVTLLGDPLLSL